jgi:hypothetical protein
MAERLVVMSPFAFPSTGLAGLIRGKERSFWKFLLELGDIRRLIPRTTETEKITRTFLLPFRLPR